MLCPCEANDFYLLVSAFNLFRVVSISSVSNSHCRPMDVTYFFCYLLLLVKCSFCILSDLIILILFPSLTSFTILAIRWTSRPP